MGGDVALTNPLTELLELLFVERSACSAELAAVAKEEAVARVHADRVRAEFAARLEEKAVAEKAAFDAQSRSQQAREALARAERQGTIAAAKAAQLTQIAKLSESAKVFCQIGCRSQRTVQTQVNEAEVAHDIQHHRRHCPHESCFAALDAPKVGKVSHIVEGTGDIGRADVVAMKVDDRHKLLQQDAVGRENDAAFALHQAVVAEAESQTPTSAKLAAVQFEATHHIRRSARKAKVTKQPCAMSAASTSRLTEAATALQHHARPLLALAVCQDPRGAGCMPSTGKEGRRCSRGAGVAVKQSFHDAVGGICLETAIPVVMTMPRGETGLQQPISTASEREALPGGTVEVQEEGGGGWTLEGTPPPIAHLFASKGDVKLLRGSTTADSCTTDALVPSCMRRAQDELGRREGTLNPCFVSRLLQSWRSILQQRPRATCKHGLLQPNPKAASRIFTKRRSFLCTTSRWAPKRRWQHRPLSGNILTTAGMSVAVQEKRTSNGECPDAIMATSRVVGCASRLLPSKKQPQKESRCGNAGRNVWGGG
mmetsp:Transcript_125330/g.250172  ORF Transcript_125330/g.250172 Transcript_125330/m.250172 type:complete len:541 (-) Transcript_125330:17-1639(-)